VTDARTNILARLRQAERTGRVPVASAPIQIPPAVPRAIDERVRRFVEELAALGVEAHVETAAADVRARVASIVAGLTVFSWDPACLPYDVASVIPNAIRGDSPRDQQAAAGIGVTGCDAALADTGSLVLLTGAGRPRAASLLPPTHLAIVRLNDLRDGAEEYFRDRGDAIASAANCTFVTGPSRTADIELTLTVGVHGPGRVIVVVGPTV
jgi:L-lactate dehydrogenase complex protein LldG